MLRTSFMGMLPIILCGCSAISSVVTNPSVTPAAVVVDVQCELQDAIARYASASFDNKWILGWKVKYDLTLDDQRDASGGISSSVWTIPISGGTGPLGADAKLSRSDGRKRTLTQTHKIADLAKYDCGAQRLTLAQSGQANVVPANGGLGFHSVIADIGDARRATVINGKAPTGPSSFGLQRRFVLNGAANLKPGISIINLSVTGSIGGAKTQTNTLDLAFSEIVPTPPTHVIVDNIGGPSKSSDTDVDRTLDLLTPQ